MSARPDRAAARYAAVWRWHFYAGLLCVPLVLWLALTGSIYLWRPQIEGWLDRPYDRLAVGGGARATPDAQAAAALAAVPGAHLHNYVLPERIAGATRILVMKDGVDRRVLVDPHGLAVLNVAIEERRPMRLLFRLHGELLAGAWGSVMVECAACWAIAMILTGLYLWWPRGPMRLAGLVYPRLSLGGRAFWRDLHGVAGLWSALLAIGLIVTGLPWAAVWGSYLTDVRAVTGSARGPVDWTIGGKPQHEGHGGMAMPTPTPRSGELTRVAAAVAPLGFAPPVAIAPPRTAGAPWTVASAAADRPLRSDVEVDGATGRILGRVDFAQRHWIDRAVGYGAAAHEGALFGLANQLLGTLAAALLALLSVSGAVLWWRRRPHGLLGAPRPAGRARFGWLVAVVIALLGLLLPLFGLTLVVVLLFDSVAAPRLPRVARWLGLARQAVAR